MTLLVAAVSHGTVRLRPAVMLPGGVQLSVKCRARRFSMSAAAGILGCFTAGVLAAPPPMVRGPESVQDWKTAGDAFIRHSERLQPNFGRAKNVILFVGDGMGIATLTAARILDGQTPRVKGGKGLPGGEQNALFFESFPYVALSKTYSWDQQTPDSAPTMTAMVTGYKAREGMLSVDHTTTRFECDAETIRSRSLETILELAAKAGKWTGVVSTARLTHATPAANYAHTAYRDWESDADIRRYERLKGMPAQACTIKDIARQLIELPPPVRQSLRVAMGGGRAQFLPQHRSDPENADARGQRMDGRDLTAEWVRTRGGGGHARYVWNKADFQAVNPDVTAYLLGLFEHSHMQFEADRPADPAAEPSLADMTAKAIQMLSRRPGGFYLHVEAGRIDHAHHAGDPYRALTDTIELARAVQTADRMTDSGETLIIVTADHSHTFTLAGYPHRGNPILGKVSPVPEYDGDPVHLAKDLLGLPYTTVGYANGPGYAGASFRKDGVTAIQPGGPKSYPHNPEKYTGSTARPDLTGVDTTTPDYLPEATVPLSSETHGGEDVAIFAQGPMAHLVRGVMEQNWIFYVMKRALAP